MAVEQPAGEHATHPTPPRGRTVSTAQQVPDLTLNNMTRIGALDAGRSLFFGHQDPQLVTKLGTWRVPA